MTKLQPEESVMKNTSDMDAENLTIDEFSKNVPLARDSVLISTTKLSGTPRPHHIASAETSHRISVLTENEPSTRRPYLSNTDLSVTNRQYNNSYNGSSIVVM